MNRDHDIDLHPAIAKLVDQIAAEPSVERIVLFGSRANGTAHERSDYDIAVEGAEPAAWHRILEAAEDAETLLKIDLMQREQLSGYIECTVQREGVTLYEQG